MANSTDWHDYLEPEQDGPNVHCVFYCPQCGYREVVPESGSPTSSCAPHVVCPTCKSDMYEEAES
ncbi:MAG: hypothetical protein M0Z55_03055 [Peptococcaceae bacterium]|nr:hypothetical protein [Peptococcaceae bacterium]